MASSLPTRLVDRRHATAIIETMNITQVPVEEASGNSTTDCDGVAAAAPHASCAGGRQDCHACGGQPGDHGAASVRPPITGWRFAWTSVGVFVVPLALAVAGACWFRNEPASQLAAGAGGLLLGMTLAGVTAKLGQRTDEANS